MPVGDDVFDSHFKPLPEQYFGDDRPRARQESGQADPARNPIVLSVRSGTSSAVVAKLQNPQILPTSETIVTQIKDLVDKYFSKKKSGGKIVAFLAVLIIVGALISMHGLSSPMMGGHGDTIISHLAVLGQYTPLLSLVGGAMLYLRWRSIKGEQNSFLKGIEGVLKKIGVDKGSMQSILTLKERMLEQTKSMCQLRKKMSDRKDSSNLELRKAYSDELDARNKIYGSMLEQYDAKIKEVADSISREPFDAITTVQACALEAQLRQ